MSETTVSAHVRHSSRRLPYAVRQHQRLIYGVNAPIRAKRPDLKRLIRGGDFGIVSAERSNLSDTENRARSEALELFLIELGYIPYPTDGVYTYQDGTVSGERSFFVPDLSREHALAIGRRWSQESVVVKHNLLDSKNGYVLMTYEPRQTIYGAKARKLGNYSVIHYGAHELPFTLVQQSG